MTSPNVPNPEVDDVSATGAALQIVNNTDTVSHTYSVSCNTAVYLASQATVSATAGLLCQAGSTFNLLVPAGGGVWSFSSGADEVTVQQVG